MFNFMKTHHIVFHNSGTILHSHQLYARFPITTQTQQNWLFLIFCALTIAIHPSGCEVVSCCGLIYISLRISDIEHLMCLSDIDYLWKNGYPRSLPTFELFCCCWILEVLYVFWILIYKRCVICKYSLKFYKLPFLISL